MSIINLALVADFLQSHLALNVSNVTLIGAGMFSQAFSFNLNQQEFIIRLNRYKEDFQKDAFAYQQFASTDLPIPSVIQCARFDESYYFAITERCPGTTLNKLKETSIKEIIPSLFGTLHKIHILDVSKYSGWGLTNASGYGRFASWEEYLLSFYNQKFAFPWKQLFYNTFMEQDLYKIILTAIQNYLPLCLTNKYWVHGDFGFDNVMSDGQKITGVLDWAESRLGDFVYDIAYLEFWSKHISYKQLWQEWLSNKKLNLHLSNFEERMQCYMLHIGLGSLAIAAIQNNIEDYQNVKARVQMILNIL